MKFIKLIIVANCFLFCLNVVIAQTTNSSFERITTKEGLSQSTVNYIIQDRKGFMWFATYGGINKYDGYSIKVYRNIVNNKNSISNNGIIYLYEDHDGFIWAVNNANKGVDRFDPVTESFTRFCNDPNDTTSISSNEVYRIFQDKSGNIWINTKKALDLLEYKKRGDKTIARFKHFYNTTNSLGFSLTYENRDGQLLLFADSLYCFDRKTFKISCTHVPLNRSFLKSISEDKAGNLWLGTEEHGIIKLEYNSRTKCYTRADLKDLNITSNNRNFVLVDNEDRIWICTETKGLFQYNQKENRLINFLNEKNNPNSISDNTVYSLCLDRSGVMWIGTFSQGLCKFDFYQKPFLHFKSIPGNTNSLNGNVISSIHSNTPGELWVGFDSNDGIDRLILQNDKLSQILHYRNSQKDIGSNRILCLVQRRNGDVWCGNATESMLCLTPEKPGTRQYAVQKIHKVNRWTFSIYEDKSGTLWGGTWGAGLWRYNDKTEQFTYFKNDPGNPRSLCDNIVWSISEDSFGNLWVGGHSEGISILPASEKSKSNPCFINYKHEDGNKYSLSDNTIHVISRDHNGSMWIGTGSGLNRALSRDFICSDPNKKPVLKFLSYHVKDGLQSEVIVGILEDERNNLWLSTSNGLSKFITAKDTFINFDDKDGLQSNEFWHNAYFKDRNGRMYFGGQNGFNAFYPDSIKANPCVPEVVFTELRIFNNQVSIGERLNGDVILTKSINQTSSIILSNENNAFTLEFAALLYNHPKKNQYTFKLEGYDKSWNNVKNRHEATYTNLNPGRYILKVKAANYDGIWNNKESTIEIIILPPWWQTWWFRLLVLLMVTGSFFAIYYIRLALYRKRQEELTALVKERSKELTLINEKLIDRQARIEEYAEEVKVTNDQLLERQARIEKQNEQLLEKQRLIEQQSLSLQKINQELSILNSTKDKFFSIIAHDLRNPFNAVYGFSDILLRNHANFSTEKINHFLTLINRSALSGNALLENLLQWSRAQTGRISFDPVLLSLNEVVKDVINLLEAELQRKSLQIIQDYEPGTMVFADENMLLTILRNLVSNAIKFSEENGNITLSAVSNNCLIEIAVADNGVGISPESMKLLFNIDTNVSTKGTANESGTGLGLIICKEFVERNGGNIWAESRLGEGSKFVFTLPLTQ